jgi:hypothetical protein
MKLAKHKTNVAQLMWQVSTKACVVKELAFFHRTSLLIAVFETDRLWTPRTFCTLPIANDRWADQLKNTLLSTQDKNKYLNRNVVIGNHSSDVVSFCGLFYDDVSCHIK